jgi:hypothetical protein
LDPATLSNLHGWRSSFGPGPNVIAPLIDAATPPPIGTAIPDDAASIAFDGSGFDNLHISAVIARVDGTWHELTLDEVLDNAIRTELTPGDAGGRLVGFRVAQPPEESARIEHHIGEGNTSEEARPIDVVLQRVETASSDGRATSLALRGDQLRAADAVVEEEADGAVRVSGSILGVSILVTPLGPGQDDPVSAVVDPVTASTAVDGIIVAETSSGTVRLRPVAVVDRFPGFGSRFIIADIDALEPALDLLQPGAGTANEVWLATDSPGDERALASRLDDPTFDVVDVDRRVDRQTALASDPLAVVTLFILVASAVVAMLLGACAVILGAAADAAEDRPLLRMLALERVRGRRLVTMVAGKSMAAVVIAIPLGLVGGRWLLQIATRLVAVSATSVLPNPPLRLAVPWLVIAAVSLVLLVVLSLGSLWGALAARRVPSDDLMRGTA